MSRVVVVGDTETRASEVVELLVEFTDVVIDVAGRDGRRARAFVDEHPPPVRDRLRPVVVDAADEGLGAALTGCRLVVLAAGTPELSQSTAAAALEAGPTTSTSRWVSRTFPACVPLKRNSAPEGSAP